MTHPQQIPAPTVLVVDDDEGIRTMLRLALPRFGITALFASSGEEAVEVYRNRGPSVDLVLSDVRMGAGMDGPQTVAALLRLNPAMRFCFMSGDSGGYSDADLLALGAARVFRKPFLDLDEFARELREAAARG
jgi:CheY-like chemotaxis protein